MENKVSPMKCEVCAAADRVEQRIRYSLTIDGQLLVVDNVPAEVCPNCGEVTLSPSVVNSLYKIVETPAEPLRTIQTPVFDFAA